MSLATWKREFYPVPASDAAESLETALRHSLRKWVGARLENTTAHGVEYHNMSIIDCNSSDTFRFGGQSCALCRLQPFFIFGPSDCSNCVVTKHDKQCDDGLSAYSQSYNDPEPAIILLEKIIRDCRFKSTVL